MAFRKALRITLLGALLATCGVVAYFLTQPSGYRFSAGDVSFRGSDADLDIDGMHVVQNAEGVKQWELWADSARVYRGKDVTVLKNLRLRFYPNDGETADVSARQGTMENKSRNMRISGDVVILASDGVSLKTDALRFRPGEKRIASDSRVLIEGARFRLSGTGLRGRTDLGRYELREKVSATIYGSGEAASPSAERN